MSKRSILAVLAGIIGASAIIYLLIPIGHKIFPIDEKAMEAAFKSKDEATLRTFFLNLPLGSYLTVIAAHAFGILGGLIIGRLIDKTQITHLLSILVIMLLMSVLNFLTIPHPTWFPFADLGTTLGISLGYIGYVWGRRKKA